MAYQLQVKIATSADQPLTAVELVNRYAHGITAHDQHNVRPGFGRGCR